MNRQYQQFTREEELELFRRWREDGDREAYTLLVESQIGWAKRWATRRAMDMKLPGGCMQWDELEAAAFDGILVAVDKFDPARGTRLTTLTAWAIRTAVDRRDAGGPILLPKYHTAKSHPAYQLAKQWSSLTPSKQGSELDSGGGSTNYQGNLSWEPSAVNGDPLAHLVLDEESEELCRALTVLSKVESDVIRGRFWKHETLAAIGDRHGVTKERIRQIEVQAIGKLRDAMGVIKGKPR